MQIVPLHGGQLRFIGEHFGIPTAHLTDFSANINPDGPPVAVLQSLRSSLEDSSLLTAYPDLEEVELKQAIAQYAGVDTKNIAVANGFVPLLASVLRLLKARSCLLPVPAFVEYRTVLEQAGVEIRPSSLSPNLDFCYDMDALVAGDHDVVLLANPQNPCGALTEKAFILRLVQECSRRNKLVLLDEAFIDYIPSETFTQNAIDFNNIIVFRSLTKFYGIPGLRVAYAVANREFIRKWNTYIAPWSITTLASRAVIAALRDGDFSRQTTLQNKQRKSTIEVGLRRIGLQVYPSAANFVLVRLPDTVCGNVLWQRMILESRLVLRNCENYEGLSSQFMRLSVRSESENVKLVEALHRCLSS